MSKIIQISPCEMMCEDSGVKHKHTSKNRHERRKMAALLKIRNAEMKAAADKLIELRKKKLPTVGISNIGMAAKVKKFGHLSLNRLTKNHSEHRKVLKPLYKAYQNDIGILKYIEAADRREEVRQEVKMNKVFDMFPETMLETIRAGTSKSTAVDKTHEENSTKSRELEREKWNWIGDSEDEEND